MTPEERTTAVTKAAERIVKNLETMKSDEKQAYVEKLVNLLSDQHLFFLDFSIEMTPNAPVMSEAEVNETIQSLLKQLPAGYPPAQFSKTATGYRLQIEHTTIFRDASGLDAIKHTKNYVEARDGHPDLPVGVIYGIYD